MNQETILNKFAMMTTALMAATLAACGGGGGGGTSPGDGGGVDPLAADCTPSASIQYGSTGGVYAVQAARTVVEMENAAQAVADGPHTLQATALTPGAATFGVYALQGGRCHRVVAETPLAAGAPTRATGPLAAAQDRVFLVLDAPAPVLVQVCAYAGAARPGLRSRQRPHLRPRRRRHGRRHPGRPWWSRTTAPPSPSSRTTTDSSPWRPRRARCRIPTWWTCTTASTCRSACR